MQTFSIRWFEKSSVAFFVVPRLIGWARFHGRKYVDKARMIAPFGDYFFNTLVFSEIVAADEFNLQAIFLSQSLCVSPNLFPKWFRPLGIVEDPYTVGIQETSHPRSITDTRNSPCNDHPIKAGKRSPYFACMTISEKFHQPSPQNQNIFEETCSHMAKPA